MIRFVLAAALIFRLFAAAAPADEKVRTGNRFRTELHELVTANWRSVELRDVLDVIQTQRQTAILLDRRIDPNAKWPIEFVNESLLDGLTNLASQFAGGVSCPDNVIYLGPEPVASKLRTLIAQRTSELSNFEPPNSISKDRQQRWLKTRTVRWDDLDSPREILDRLQMDWNFQIANPELVEHDLWAKSELPEVTGVAALSLVLIQFDLTFRWQDGANAVELIPLPEIVVIEKQHKPRGKSADQQLAEWQTRYPSAKFRKAGREILVTATEEVHEELSAGPPKRKKPVENPADTPLDQRVFTLEIKDVAANELMLELEKSGIVFEYDPQELAAAKIDLKRPIQLNVRDLPAKEFFKAVFDPLGVKFTIRGKTVTLKPK